MDNNLPAISLDDDPLYIAPTDYSRSSTSPAPQALPSQPIDIPFNYPSSPFASNFPGTPSYQGSFGSQHSPSHNWGGRSDLHIFDDEAYNPSEYDLPADSNAMYPSDISPYMDMINDEFDFNGPAPAVSVVPADGTQNPMFNPNSNFRSMFKESPASSMEDHRSPSPIRSRASSNASSDGSHSHVRRSSNSLVDNVGSSFEPQWGVTAPSPPASAASPPANANGSRSPPALLIPDAPPTSGAGGLFPPGQSRIGMTGLNTLAADGGGPGINLIPATPVSGGGNGATAPFARPFDHHPTPSSRHSSVEPPQRPPSSQAGPSSTTSATPASAPNHSIGLPAASDMQLWMQNDSSAGVSINVPTPGQSPNLAAQFQSLDPNSNGMFRSNTAATASNPPSPYMHPQMLSHSPSPQHSPLHMPLELGLNVPFVKRERSKSDTFSSSQRPAWAMGVTSYSPNPPPQSTSPAPAQENFAYAQRAMADLVQNESHLFMNPPASADAYQNSFQRYGNIAPHQQLPNFGQSNQAPSFLGGGGGGDVYLSVDSSMRRARSDAGGHRRAAKSEDFGRSDYSHGLLAPPSHPSLMVPSADPFGRGRDISNGSYQTHQRRASSGSRSAHGGSASGASSVRASPYPSPNASPMVGYAQLQPDVASVNMNSLNISSAGTDLVNSAGVTVARPHVTTSATSAASNLRRTSEATFTCPVPGCGSTFTRHFNLKGHMRSHNDERPFKCKWPGCEKGFARQHDCKRHEQLHLNIRPYTCEGCSRTFARMDALNRHLRSEGGAECAKHQQPLTEEKVPKSEDQAWRPGAVIT